MKKSDLFYVLPKFRLNPLSFIPSSIEVTVGNRIYNNIQNKKAFLATVSNNAKYFDQDINSEADSVISELYNDVAMQHPNFEDYSEDTKSFLIENHKYKASNDDDFDYNDDLLKANQNFDDDVIENNIDEQLPKIFSWHCAEERKRMKHIYKE